MTPFVLTRRAKADLEAIGRYTEGRWGRDQRNRYLRQLDDAFHMLAGNPEGGVDCGWLRSGYRKLPCGSHLIFYRTTSDQIVEVVRILHKRRDVEKVMGDA